MNKYFIIRHTNAPRFWAILGKKNNRYGCPTDDLGIEGIILCISIWIHYGCSELRAKNCRVDPFGISHMVSRIRIDPKLTP